MENNNQNDKFIRELIQRNGIEKPPYNFTEKVMRNIKTNPVIDDTPLLSTGTWIAIVIGVAAMIVMIFTLDIPYFDQIFSSSGIRQISMNIFSQGFYHTMTTFFKGLNISSISVGIVAATLGLITLERLLHKRFSEMGILTLL